jgi:hypothetical protein
MAPNFVYSLKPVRSGEGVFKYWDDQNLWPELNRILTEKFVRQGRYLVAPRQAADGSLNYHGYTAGIRIVPTWKESGGGKYELAFFVKDQGSFTF